MALHLDDDDQVLAAALSLLDDVETETYNQPSRKKRKTRNYNPNRAREAHHKELLALRELVPRLQRRLEILEEENQRRNVEVAVETNDSLDVWKKAAIRQRISHADAEEENRRLRAAVHEQTDILTRNLQQLLRTGQRQTQMYQRWSQPWRTYAVPIDRCDGAMFRELADSIDTVYHQVLQIFCPHASSEKEIASPDAQKAHRRMFADKILPFDLDATGAAAWHFFGHSFRRPTTRFYYHTDAPPSPGFVSDDTVVESFGEEHHIGQVRLDLKVKQIIRLYRSKDRIVVAWRALLSPDEHKVDNLNGIMFEEKGALVIEPYASKNSTNPASIIHTWQVISPDLYGRVQEAQSKSIQELAEFVITDWRPGQAVETMERTLHFNH